MSDRKPLPSSIENFLEFPVTSALVFFVFLFLSQVWGVILLCHYRKYVGDPNDTGCALTSAILTTIALILIVMLFYLVDHR